MRFFFPLLLFFTVYLLFIFFDYSSIHQWMKPFLIPSLLFFYLINLKGKPQLKLIGALLLSAVGDALLMFNGPDFFIFGLVAFLFAHILYVFIFKSFLKRLIINRFILLCSFLIGLYYVLLMRFLWPSLGDMKIPVLAYAFVISMMLWLSLQVSQALGTSAKYIFLGAFFFVFSDTLLSLQLFHTDFYRAHLFVMLTYLLAQVLLVYGLIYVETRKYIISD